MNIEVTPEIEGLVKKIADLYRSNLVGSIASGELLEFTTDISFNNERFVVSFILPDHWKYVEYGRSPGRKQPPISAIEDWIRIKPIIPDGRTGKIPDTRQLAFLIARSIGEKGIEAKKPLTKALYSDEAESLITQIKQEILSQVRNYIAESINA